MCRDAWGFKSPCRQIKEVITFVITSFNIVVVEFREPPQGESLVFGFSASRAEGEADFACGDKPQRAKCVDPFNARRSKTSPPADK